MDIGNSQGESRSGEGDMGRLFHEKIVEKKKQEIAGSSMGELFTLQCNNQLQ